MDGYSLVWQTWDLVYVPHTNVDTGTTANTMVTQNLRHDVQRARIAKRLSIPALASKIQCDVATLADFERGDDILPKDVQTRLVRELGLSTTRTPSH